MTSASRLSTLDRISDLQTHTFAPPTKHINDGADLTSFLSSTAYRDLMTWLLQLNRSMFPTKDPEGKVQPSSLTAPPIYSETVRNLRSLISSLESLIEQAPPETGPRRFGNVAFRTWMKLVDDGLSGLLHTCLLEIFDRSADQKVALEEELTVYLLGSFGSAQRLDYGTGHELSFLAFLACLWKLGAFEAGEERAIVVGVMQPYLQLIRRLVLTYTLEPAGSHGVWGLDDHSFTPYVFGSAQYGPAIFPDSTLPTPTEGSVRPSPSPSKVTDKDAVADYKDSNMYFSAIQFIYDVKRGPFWEHSPVLYDISGIKDGWAKINKGMIKMWAAEVLGKFPVVQHFPFGSLFEWKADPAAVSTNATVHAQQQPRSMDVPPPPPAGMGMAGGAGTKAPWAKAGGGAMPVSTGVPSSRAPWAATQRQSPSTSKPLASTQRPAGQTIGMPPPTTAPWARKDGG